MKTTLKLEEFVKLIACYLISLKLGFSFWVFFAWLLLPDISMLGYTINARVGAVIYNLFHHQGIAIIVLLYGFYTASVNIEFAGLILLGHSSMDRVFGYGLKFPDSFKHTHLGELKGGTGAA
jgi:Domain of unknown function (DUF4260)